MPDAIWVLVGWVGVTAAAGLVCAVLARGRVRWLWLASALLLMAAYDALLTRGYGYIPLDFGPSDWNWEGKALAVALSLGVAAALGFRRTGVTLRHYRTGLPGALALSAVLVALFLGLALYFPGEPTTADTLAFQLTMPGLDEELFYRGVLLVMLNEAFGRPLSVLGAPMGWGAPVSSVAFGLTHALGYADGGYSFDAMAMALTGGPALLLVWLREKTGSLVLPILLHNFANSIFHLV
ncbi:CPBP family intramembrane glutamic endopeptidase, BDIM_20840 family [Brevundimonas sp.]|uniref:CPBP family intramembrane glutamic endopeptidase, BDIM_20840 family n=1 Tax=Brevundimonas sp. TaxID=1871086 RepID=UPI002ED7C4B2